MFIGHYAAALAIRRRTPGLNLGVLFVAVQLVDLAFFTFVLLGIERLRIVPGFTETNPYDLHDMPYTHSLVVTPLWGLVAGVVWRLAGGRYAMWVGLAVASHFLLDVPMHIPDLPVLFGDGPKIGLGLWNSWVGATLLEGGLFAAAAVLYLTRPDRVAPIARATWILLAVMGVLALSTAFFPVPANTAELAAQSLSAYALLAIAAWRIDRPVTA